MNRTFKIRCSAIGKIMGESKPKGGLSATCITYLKEWYANDQEEISSKYTDKGIMCENDAIDMFANVLGYGMCRKNTVRKENDFMEGTCDIEVHNVIGDVKCPWDRKSFNDSTEQINSDYEWQLIGYCHLYGKEKGILFYALLDTPEEVNYGEEVIYSDQPESERWYAFEVKADTEKVNLIEKKVIQCREWLDEYDKKIKSRIGKVIKNVNNESGN